MTFFSVGIKLSWMRPSSFFEPQFLRFFNRVSFIVTFGMTVGVATSTSAQFVQKTTPRNNLSNLYFYNDQLGFIAYTGISKTTDGGETWREIKFTSPDSILYIFQFGYKFHFFNELQGVAVTTSLLTGGGAVMKTTDGGETWTLKFFDTAVEIDDGDILPIGFTDVHFFDNTHGFAVGGKGRRIVTTDGGETWTRHDMPVNTDYTDLFFINASIGFAGSEAGLFKTTNGGSTWTNLDNSRNYQSIHFLDALNGYAIASGRIVKTTDGGTTWSEYERDLGGFYRIFFSDLQNGYAVGYGEDGRNLFVTRNGGLLWEPAAQQFEHSLTDVMFRNTNMGYVTGLTYPDYSYFGKTTAGVGLTVPVTDFSFTLGNACVGDIVQFNNEGVESYSHTWFVNDKPVSNSYNLQYAFPDFGSYTVRLETTHNGYTTSHTETLGFAYPQTYPPVEIWRTITHCSGDQFFINIRNPEQALDYEPWFEGQPLAYTQERSWDNINIYITNGIPHSGEIIVKTTRKNSAGCVDPFELPTGKVYVDVAPRNYVLEYELSPASLPVCRDSTVRVMIHKSSPQIYYELTNVHREDVTGTYSDAKNGNGGDLTFTIYPYAEKDEFKLSYSSPCGNFVEYIDIPGSTVLADYTLPKPGLYTDEAMVIKNESSGIQFQWDFGEGAQPRTSAAANPGAITYTSPGAKLIKLTVTDAGGCVSQKDTLQFVAQRISASALSSCGSSTGEKNLTKYYQQDSDTDLAGNVIVTGNYFDTLYYPGSYAIAAYVHKYDADGNLLWKREVNTYLSRQIPFGNDGHSYGRAVTTDREGNIYLLMDYTLRRVVIGDAVIGHTERSGWLHPQVSVLKYSPDGTLLWTVDGFEPDPSRPSSNWILALDIDTDSEGNVYFTTSGAVYGSSYSMKFPDGELIPLFPPYEQWDPENLPRGNQLFKITPQGKHLGHWYYGTDFYSASHNYMNPYEMRGKLFLGGKMVVDKNDRVVVTAMSFSTQNESDYQQEFHFGDFAINSNKQGLYMGVFENGKWTVGVKAAEISEVERTVYPFYGFVHVVDQLAVDPDNNAIYATGHWIGSNFDYMIQGNYKKEISVVFDGEEIWDQANAYVLKLNYAGARQWVNFQSGTLTSGIQTDPVSGKLFTVGTVDKFGMFNSTSSNANGIRTQGLQDIFVAELNNETGRVLNVKLIGSAQDDVLLSDGKGICGTLSLVGGSDTFTLFEQLSFGGGCTQPPPLSISPQTNLSLCEGGSVSVTASGASHYRWLPAEGVSNPEIANPVITVASTPGETGTSERRYTVIGYADEGCASTQQIIIALEKPSVEFTYTAQAGSLTVPFTVTDPPNAGLFNWNFGDGNTGEGETISHTFPEAGTYQVSVTTENSCGVAEGKKSVEIECDLPANPDFSWNWSQQYPNKWVGFTSLTNQATRWLWDFGDGFTSDQQSVTHEYAQHGVYQVTLRSSNGCGHTFITKTINITCDPLVPDFSYTVGANGRDVTFSNLTPNGTRFDWSFSGSIFSSQQNPSYQFSELKIYFVTLTTSNGCQTVTVTKPIDLRCQPSQPSFTVSNTGLTVILDNTSLQSTSYQWDFGDNTTSTLKSPEHTYTQAGNYQICLAANNYCSQVTTCVNLTLMITGTEDPTAGVVSIAPNPFQDSFTFTLENSADIQRIEIYDALGNQIHVFDKPTLTTDQVVWMGNHRRGVYFMKIVKVSGANFIVKLIKT